MVIVSSNEFNRHCELEREFVHFPTCSQIKPIGVPDSRSGCVGIWSLVFLAGALGSLIIIFSRYSQGRRAVQHIQYL